MFFSTSILQILRSGAGPSHDMLLTTRPDDYNDRTDGLLVRFNHTSTHHFSRKDNLSHSLFRLIIQENMAGDRIRHGFT